MREVTLLLTDVEGSTRLWEHRPDAMWRALARHDALFDKLVTGYGGRVIKPRGEGDSMFCVFDSAPDALACALDLQRCLHDPDTWEQTPALPVRMSLHTGPVHERDDDLYGPTVNRGARLRGIVHGGQVVCSQATYRLVRDALPHGATLLGLGEHRLKDLLRPERAWQLCHPDLPSAFKPLKSLDPRRHNLPVVQTPLVGRDDDLAEVSKLVGPRRLVTLLGGPGVGKTRLGLQTAADALGSQPDGVWLVELESVVDARLVGEAAAMQLGLEPGRDARATVRDWLAPRQAMLVLDGCEHLAAAVAELIVDLLGACPELCVVATSREALAVPGEQVYRLRPLALPRSEAPAEAVASCASVRLFVERAASAGTTDFALADVARICDSLDGVPLAIELAAARTRHLPVADIADSLRDLVLGDALQGAIDWSYSLLSRGERTLLRRLSVFRGGTRLEAVGQVCGEDIADEATGLMMRLVDRSLVQMLEGGRYRMLEPVREFAAARLTPPEAGAVAASHASYFTRFAESASAGLDGADDVECIQALDADLDNLRAALEVQRVPIAGALGAFWLRRGLWHEGRRWLDAALGAAPGDAGLLLARGRIANRLGSHDAALPDLDAALARARADGSPSLEARILHAQAVVALDQGSLEDARHLAESSLALCKPLADDACTSQVLNVLGNIAVQQGDLDLAEAHYAECLAVRGDEESSELVGAVMLNSGAVAVHRGDHTTGIQRYEKALELLQRAGQLYGCAVVLSNLASVYAVLGETDTARLLIAECESSAQQLGAADLLDKVVAVRGLISQMESWVPTT